MRRFERHYAEDDRDFVFESRVTNRKRRLWRMRRDTLDQKDTPQCVGYAWAHWLMCDPIRQWLNPAGIYRAAQYVDEWEGVDYDGTSVRAGAKVLRNFELISEFKTTQDVEVLASVVLEDGPVCVGTNWYRRMNDPGNGLITPKGRMEGGHAYLVIGCDTPRAELTVLNSWGPSWGNNGRARIAMSDMQRLLNEDGEVWIGAETRGGE